MADVNFGILDTQAPGRIAAIPQQAQAQQTQNMLAALQAQGVMNQNELSRYNLASAQRSDASQNAVNAALKGSIVDGKINWDLLTFNLAGGAGASKIPDFLKARSEEEKRNQDILKTKGEIEKQARDAVDSELTSFTKNAFRVTDVPSLTSHLRAFYNNPLLGKIAAKFKPFDQALNDDIQQISTPEGLRQWQAENANLTGQQLTDLLLKVTTSTENLGDVSRTTQRSGMGRTIGVPVDTPIGVSANTTAQIEAARRNHLENLAQQGWTFDTDRGIAVNARLGISRPISTLMTPFGVGGAPAVSGAPATSIAPGGGVPGQRQAPAGQPAASVLGPKPTRISPNELRDEVNALTKDFRVVQDAHTKIKNVANTGAGDMSLLYSFIKLLDPGSVVRESEFAAAAQSGSYGERIQGAVNRALTGQRLPDALRQDFIREADNLYRSQKSGTDRVIKHYTGIAERAGLDPQDVIFPYAAPEVAIPEQAPAGAVRIKRK